MQSGLLFGLFDFFLVGNALMLAGAGVERSGGAVVAIPRSDAFACIASIV